MLKYTVPVLLFAAAGFVWYYNQNHADSFMLLPFLDAVPSLRGSLAAQAAWSWRIIGGVGLLVLIVNVMSEKWRKD